MKLVDRLLPALKEALLADVLRADFLLAEGDAPLLCCIHSPSTSVMLPCPSRVVLGSPIAGHGSEIKCRWCMLVMYT